MNIEVSDAMYNFCMFILNVFQCIHLNFDEKQSVTDKIENINLSYKIYPWTIMIYIHQENMSVECLPPYTPLLYSKTGVCRGIPIFLIFAPKHRLWVLIRTASPRQF